MKIGIPKALLYYYYIPLWRGFWEALGHEVVVSPQTNKDIIDQGIKVSVPEICVPIKVYNGHIVELEEMGVDYFFTPRMVSVEKHKTFCPKFLGLPDMLRYTFPHLEQQLIAPHVISAKENGVDFKELKKCPLLREYSHGQLRAAWAKGCEDWEIFRSLCFKGYLISEALELYRQPNAVNHAPKVRHDGPTVGLIGYVYDVYDEYVGMNVANRLEAQGLNVVTFEMLSADVIQKQIGTLNKSLFWTFSNKLLGAGLSFYENHQIDGIVQVTAFGCGPDSLIGKIMELDSGSYHKPFLTVRVDEHSGENHLQTRVEAFSDMLNKKYYRQQLVDKGQVSGL